MNITINGNAKQFDSENMTVTALVVTLNLTGKRLAIEKNGEIVPRSKFDAVNCKRAIHWKLLVRSVADKLKT